MSSASVFVYIARPTTKVRLRGLFDSGPLKQLLERPGALRDAGWTMETLDQAKIIRGEYLEVGLGDLLTVQLYEDGMLIAKAKADANFLAWGSGRRNVAENPRLNPLALIEFTHSFVNVYRRALEHCDPKPTTLVFRVAIQNAGVAEDERLYLNPYGLETWAHLIDRNRYRAPADAGEIETQIPFAVLRDNPARAAYLLVERIYLWFGVPTNEIPYTVGEGEQKALDLEMIRRGGKPPAG